MGQAASCPLLRCHGPQPQPPAAGGRLLNISCATRARPVASGLHLLGWGRPKVQSDGGRGFRTDPGFEAGLGQAWHHGAPGLRVGKDLSSVPEEERAELGCCVRVGSRGGGIRDRWWGRQVRSRQGLKQQGETCCREVGLRGTGAGSVQGLPVALGLTEVRSPLPSGSASLSQGSNQARRNPRRKPPPLCPRGAALDQ